jgi:hypothetical protein
MIPRHQILIAVLMFVIAVVVLAVGFIMLEAPRCYAAWLWIK